MKQYVCGICGYIHDEAVGGKREDLNCAIFWVLSQIFHDSVFTFLFLCSIVKVT